MSVQNEIFSVGMRPINDAHSPLFVILGDLAAAIRNRTDIVFGLYHSLFEWFNPLFLEDKKQEFATQLFPQVFMPMVPSMNAWHDLSTDENPARTERDCRNVQTISDLVRWWLG